MSLPTDGSQFLQRACRLFTRVTPGYPWRQPENGHRLKARPGRPMTKKIINYVVHSEVNKSTELDQDRGYNQTRNGQVRIALPRRIIRLPQKQRPTTVHFRRDLEGFPGRRRLVLQGNTASSVCKCQHGKPGDWPVATARTQRTEVHRLRAIKLLPSDKPHIIMRKDEM